MKPRLESFAERAWYAYLALPRSKRGKPPPYRSLEGEDGSGKPAYATFSKLFKGDRTDPRVETRDAIATVLGVSRAWLDNGIGEPPSLTGPYREMPRDEGLREHDPSEWARKYEAIGGVAAPPDNFRLAVLYLAGTIDAETIEKVAAEARGREGELPPVAWGARLAAAQKKRHAERASTAKRKRSSKEATGPRREPGAEPKRRAG